MLLEVLRRSQELGFLGPGPVEPHIDHARAFLRALVPIGPSRALDLGSGGGLPGLVLALETPAVEWVLLDASERRTAFLDRAVADLGLGDRVTVVRDRAEAAGHGPLRAAFDVVVSRSFGPPAMTAECGGAFLRQGGSLLVSEPPVPDADERWPAAGLARLGLVRGALDGGIQRVDLGDPWPDAFPRRWNAVVKRPLW